MYDLPKDIEPSLTPPVLAGRLGEPAEHIRFIVQRHLGAFDMHVAQGALTAPSAMSLPPISKAIQALKFTDFVLAGKWCVPGTSDPNSIRHGLARRGLSMRAIGRAPVDTLIEAVGYFEPQVDTDVRQLHINLAFEGTLVATIRLRLLSLPDGEEDPWGNPLRTLRRTPGSLCLAGPFAELLDSMDIEQSQYLLHCVRQGHIAELTSYATIFGAAKARHEHLINPEDAGMVREVCRNLKKFLSGYFREDWAWIFLSYTLSLAVYHTHRLGARFLISPTDFDHMPVYQIVLGDEFTPQAGIPFSSALLEPDQPAIILGEGPTDSRLLEFVREGDTVSDIRTGRDNGRVAITCFPVHAKLLAYVLNRLDRIEHRLQTF